MWAFSDQFGGLSDRGTEREVITTTRIQNVCLSFDLKGIICSWLLIVGGGVFQSTLFVVGLFLISRKVTLQGFSIASLFWDGANSSIPIVFLDQVEGDKTRLCETEGGCLLLYDDEDSSIHLHDFSSFFF